MSESKLRLDHDWFETVIMFKVLTDELYLATAAEHLRPEYFKDKNKQLIIGIISEFYLKRQTVPSIPEIKAYLTDAELKKAFKSVVAEFNAFDKKINQDELYENTETFLKEKAVFHAVLKIISESEKGKMDTARTLESMEKACSITLMHNIGFDYFNQIDQHITDVTRVDQYIPTKWKWFDKKIGGGLRQNGRALYIFAGQTNIGKSIFLGNLACNVAEQGKTVVLITLEMPEELYAKRISSKLSQIPINEFLPNAELLKESLYAYKGAHPKSRIIIKEFPPSTISPTQIHAYLRKLKNMGINPDCVVIDYLNLLTTTVGNNSYEKVKYISEQIRALSYVYACPFVSATQLNRGGVDAAEPGVEAVSESMGLPATCDVMVSLWQDDEDAELGVIKKSLMKNRFGPNFGTCVMRVNYPTLTVSEDDHTSETDEAVATAGTLDALAD